MNKKRIKKSQMVIREVKVDLFDSQIFCFWNCKPIQVATYIEKNFNRKPEYVLDWLKMNNDNPPQGVCLTSPGVNSHGIIWLSKKTPELLSHEVTHMATKMMAHWSININESTNEILAMLVGYIVKGLSEK